MSLLKVSPTFLDAFRSVQGKTQWEKDEKDLIEMLTGEFKPTPAMRFGTEVHKYIETGDAELYPKEKEQLSEFRRAFKNAEHEVYIRKQLNDDILLVFKIDALLGSEVHEFKTGSRFWGVEGYDRSFQWRVYCYGVNADVVVYHHFQYGQKRPVTFKHSSFVFYPYQGMIKEIENVSYEFLDWATRKGLQEYLKP